MFIEWFNINNYYKKEQELEQEQELELEQEQEQEQEPEPELKFKIDTPFVPTLASIKEEMEIFVVFDIHLLKPIGVFDNLNLARQRVQSGHRHIVISKFFLNDTNLQDDFIYYNLLY